VRPRTDGAMRAALVTGGAVRVGRAISEALAGDGFAVVVHYHGSAGEAHGLVEAIRAGGGTARAVRADLSRAGEVERLASEAVAAFGGLDLLVNNASVFPEAGIEETDEALLDHTLAVNLKAPFLLLRHLAPALRARRGSVVNLGDLAGIQSWASYAAHGVSKAGLLHLTRVAARALAPEVRVNAIAPGTVLPPEGLSEGEVARLAERAPLGRNGDPADVVRALRYLLAAPFVTGETLVVDGGRLLRG
jgi:pteridine reductase